MTSTARPRFTPVPPLAWVLLLTTACLIPFCNKAVHIDDTLFLRVARQIQQHPLDFFGCEMNWFGTPRPMIEVFDNPPVTCYYLALAGSILGWSEPALHLAFLLPALAAVWGIHALARRHCDRPALAAAVATFTPVFLISATTLMCDVLLLAFWVWAVVWFERGLEKNEWRAWLGCGALAGLAALTKFTGLALVPLLTAYAIVKKRPVGRWMIAPLVPVLLATGYEWLTSRLYGHGQLFGAAHFATETRTFLGGTFLGYAFLGLGYAGSCVLPVLFWMPWLWPRRVILKGLAFVVPAMLLGPFAGIPKEILLPEAGGFNWPLYLQSAVCLAAGAVILILAGTDLRNRREPVSILLGLWIAGIMTFAIALNWTINGRSFLLLAPAVGLLVVRRLDVRCRETGASGSRRMLWPILAAAAFSILPVVADYHLAGADREAARVLYSRYRQPGGALCFQGHWGFQYYLENLGAKAMDLNPDRVALAPGEIIIVPGNGCDLSDMPADLVSLREVLERRPNRLAATMNIPAGAGFYSVTRGPLPYAFGVIQPQHYYVFQVVSNGTSAPPAGGSKLGALARQLAIEKQARQSKTQVTP